MVWGISMGILSRVHTNVGNVAQYLSERVGHAGKLLANMFFVSTKGEIMSPNISHIDVDRA